MSVGLYTAARRPSIINPCPGTAVRTRVDEGERVRGPTRAGPNSQNEDDDREDVDRRQDSSKAAPRGPRRAVRDVARR